MVESVSDSFALNSELSTPNFFYGLLPEMADRGLVFGDRAALVLFIISSAHDRPGSFPQQRRSVGFHGNCLPFLGRSRRRFRFIRLLRPLL